MLQKPETAPTAVRLAGERRQGVIGAEDVGRSVDQEEVVTGTDGTRRGAVGEHRVHGPHRSRPGRRDKPGSPSSPETRRHRSEGTLSRVSLICDSTSPAR